MPHEPSKLMNEIQTRLDSFTEEELVHLNRLIVERLRIMQTVQAHGAMIQFRIGQRVRFVGHGGQEIAGTLTKYNRKSVTVVTEQGAQWNVSPALLKSVE